MPAKLNQSTLHAIQIRQLRTAPAAYHRQSDPQSVSESFIFIATRLLLFSMFPLMLALALEFYLIARVITNKLRLSIAFAIIVVIIFSTLWILLPQNRKLQRFLGRIV